jgi:YfiH family protein
VTVASTLSLPCLTDPVLGVPHGFFTRVGGVSVGPYASLNGSSSGGDDPGAVARNRALVAAALELPPTALLGTNQVHGKVVVTVDKPWVIGRGADADAMVTNSANLGLVIITADCAPVLLADREAGVVGAAHAGWRGAVAGVLEATIAAMRVLGAQHIAAAVGPCIGQDSYQVGAELRDAVLAQCATDAGFFRADGPAHWRFDLAGYCVGRLLAAGAAVTRIEADTCADQTRFFSHRRRTLAGGGPIGHQMSAIRL